MITITSTTNGYDENTFSDASGTGDGNNKVFKERTGFGSIAVDCYNCKKLLTLHGETYYELPAGFEITRGAYDTGYDDY